MSRKNVFFASERDLLASRPGNSVVCLPMRRLRRVGLMADTHGLIAQAYSSFNRRDVDGALAVMSENVDWPKASEGGRVVGKEEIRAYWTRQWAEFDPHVEPIEVTDQEAGRTEVKVHQLVNNRNGDILSDQELLHVFTIANGLIERMHIAESQPAFGQDHAT